MALLITDTPPGVSQSIALRQAALQTLASVWRIRPLNGGCNVRVREEAWRC